MDGIVERTLALCCSEDGCGQPVHSRGLCRAHYAAAWRASVRPHTERDLVAAFERFVERRDDGHWRWSGRTLGSGVPVVQVLGQKIRAAKIAWELYGHRAPLNRRRPRQTCGPEHCLNPEHLTLDHDARWRPAIDEKTCSRCARTLPVERFARNRQRPSGLNSQCLDCARAGARRHRGVRGGHADLRPVDGDRCQICGARGDLHLDHDHSTGGFRGWLCSRCNTAIGCLRDDPRLCRIAAGYLFANGAEPSDVPQEPELPTTFVRCRGCQSMVPLHAVECPECGAPHPREIERLA